MIYYYNDQGIYVANATMQSGSSIASERNSCYDDTDGGIDIPDDDGGGGGSGCTLTIEWYQCNGTNAGIPHPPGGSGLPNSCNAQNGPQTGSGYNMIWTNCVGDRSMNDFLRQPCDGNGGASGGGTSSCQPDPNNPCEIPYTLDENCDCVFADAIENGDVGVVTPKDEFLADIIEDSIITTNLDPCTENILNDLKNLTSDISNVLNRFGNVSSTYDWEIESGTPTDPSHAFETDWNRDSSGNEISKQYVTIVNPSFVNQATNLAIARVVLHEAIHAYILSYVDDLIDNSTNSTIIDSFQNNFSEVWNFYVAQQNGVSVGNIEDAHHEQMAATFIDAIGAALAEYDNNQQDIDYYYYLAWGALFETDAWNTATSFYDYEEDPYSVVDSIIIANNQEDTNGLNAVGTPCL